MSEQKHHVEEYDKARWREKLDTSQTTLEDFMNRGGKKMSRTNFVSFITEKSNYDFSFLGGARLNSREIANAIDELKSYMLDLAGALGSEEGYGGEDTGIETTEWSEPKRTIERHRGDFTYYIAAPREWTEGEKNFLLSRIRQDVKPKETIETLNNHLYEKYGQNLVRSSSSIRNKYYRLKRKWRTGEIK
jgi:hypothetical protein